MNEIWKDVKGYEGLYKVSNMGRVKSLTYRKCVHGIDTISEADIILHPVDHGNGYRYVSLTKDKKRKNHYVHRLVAEAFCGRRKGKNYVNHLDYDKSNNKASNLEWCTQLENTHYSSWKLKKMRPNYKTSTGYSYITLRDNRYRVNNEKVHVDRSFATLDEAIAFRNEVFSERVDFSG